MKSKATAFWFIVSLVLALGLVWQWSAARKQRLTLEKLQIQVEKTASEHTDEARVKELEKERMKLLGELRAAEYELSGARMSAAAALQSSSNTTAQSQGAQPINAKETPANMGKMLANMLKNPEMRKAMEQQQRMGLEMIYGTLFKQLQLTPEQESEFKDVLIKHQMENLTDAGSMFEENADRTKVAQELAEKRKENEKEIEELLGEEKYGRYQDYTATLGERMMLEQFARGAEISPEQNEQLLAIMREEKKNVQINMGQPTDGTQDWQAMLGSDEVTQRFFEQQEEVNQRVLERASQVLTPEQLQKFEPVLKSQAEMQRAGMNMARQMFGGENKPANATEGQ